MSPPGPDLPRPPNAAAPGFYARGLGEHFASHEELLAARLPRWLAPALRRSGLARGVALGLIARRGGTIAVIRRARGTLPALLVCALPPARRRIFVLELLRRPWPRSAWRRALYRAWWKLVEVPALRGGMAAGQVMSEWERDEYATHYGLAPGRLHVVRWAFRTGREPPPPPASRATRAVFSSGRTACDWPMLFAAASGAGWELTVVCSRGDREQVEALAAGGEARVLSELADAEHDELLRASAVNAIVLEDRGLSAGQVRLMSAVSAGVPVVATRVRSLEGYVVDGETGILVPPGDADRLRAAVDSLLDDPARRAGLRDQALRRGGHWTYDHYFAALRELIAAARSLEADNVSEDAA